VTSAVGDRIEVGGCSLEARWSGPGPAESPTIVLLHDGLGSVRRWKEFPDALARATGCGVFAYSRAGSGDSDPAPEQVAGAGGEAAGRTRDHPTAWRGAPRAAGDAAGQRLAASGDGRPRPAAAPSPSRHRLEREALEVLPAVLERIGFQRGILLGHSEGASIAMIYAGGVQDHRIRGLVLLAPLFFVEESVLGSVANAGAAFLESGLRERLGRYHRDVDGVFWAWNRAWLDPAFRSWDIRESIGYVRVPMLIVQGTRDEFGTVAQIDAAREEAYCPVDVAMLEGAGHVPHAEQPDAALAAISAFVSTLMESAGEAAPLRLGTPERG
jgi:pimeloyl-ACP methyl ester carboxylesterase